MTDEQITKKAEEFAYKESDGLSKIYYPCKRGYIAGAHSRDEEIKELKEQRDNFKDRLLDALEKRDQLRNQWHHVNDQMPKDHEKIFFRKKDGAKYYGWFSERMQRFFTIDPDHTKWTINGVTHWMPIPELKKGGKQ